MKQALINGLLVGTGGFFGSICRYGLSLGLQRWSHTLPAGTMAANLAGCFVIGLVVQLAVPAGWLSPGARLLLATGFCGGFTTLSSMMYETAQLLRDGEVLHTTVYLGLTLAGSMTLFYLGLLSARFILKTAGGS